MHLKLILSILSCICFTLSIYISYFHRPPTDDILAANAAAAVGDDDGHRSDDDDSTELTNSRRQWDRWVADNHFVSVGKVYDDCGNERLQNDIRVVIDEKDLVSVAYWPTIIVLCAYSFDLQ